MAAVLMVLAAPAAAGGLPTAVSQLFPMAADAPRLDRTLKVNGDEGGQQELTSVIFSAPAGGPAGRATDWCGLVVPRSGSQVQGIVTIGQGFTEALSCNGVAEAALMPAAGAARRLGLIYRTSSRNASSLTPVVLARDPATGVWREDDTLVERLGELPGPVTLGRMKRILSQTP